MPHPSFDDPILTRLLDTVPVPPLEPSPGVFHDLAGCILEQQHPARSTKRLFSRMLEHAGLDRLTLEAVPRFEAHGLTSAKLSGRKLDAFASAVAVFQDRQIDWTALPDEAVRAELATIRGVGGWTRDMILLFTLERPDVFPSGDYHLKKAMTQLYALDPNHRLRAQMMDLAHGWRPHRSFAVRTLLAWREWQNELAK